MDTSIDTNAAIWKTDEIVRHRASTESAREEAHGAQRRLLAALLPFGADDAFTFVDLGAGTGSAARAILTAYPRSTAILADFSPQMMALGAGELAAFAGRYRYVEFDMSTNVWPAEIPTGLDAAVTSMSVHHLPDHRKEGLFAEIFDRLAPGGWYLNYDSIATDDGVVESAWERGNDHLDPAAADKRLHRNPAEQARHENHVQYLIPLPQQLGYLRAAGFEGIDVYWKRLDDVIYGGRRPL